MEAGVALPVMYLAGQVEIGRGAPYEAALGPVPRCLETLRGWGATLVELRGVGPCTPSPSAVRAACQGVREAGLHLSIHAALPEGPVGSWVDDMPSVLAGIEGAEDAAPRVVVHAFAEERGSLRDLARRTRERMAEVIAAAAREGMPLRLALETNRQRHLADPSTVYHGLLAMLDGLDPAVCGACWDFGHMCANVRLGVEKEDPPAAFLARVAHVHVHDLGPPTHMPLTVGNVPLQRWIGLLAAHGYSGPCVLELNLDRIEEDGARALADSLHILRRTIARAEERPSN